MRPLRHLLSPHCRCGCVRTLYGTHSIENAYSDMATQASHRRGIPAGPDTRFNRRPDLSRPGCHGGCNNFFFKAHRVCHAKRMDGSAGCRGDRWCRCAILWVHNARYYGYTRVHKVAEDAAKKSAFAARNFGTRLMPHRKLPVSQPFIRTK